jgi:hypothetical protein
MLKARYWLAQSRGEHLLLLSNEPQGPRGSVAVSFWSRGTLLSVACRVIALPSCLFRSTPHGSRQGLAHQPVTSWSPLTMHGSGSCEALLAAMNRLWGIAHKMRHGAAHSAHLYRGAPSESSNHRAVCCAGLQKHTPADKETLPRLAWSKWRTTIRVP